MKDRTHSAFAVVSAIDYSLITGQFLGQKDWNVWLFVGTTGLAIIGGLLPNIDNSESSIGQKFCKISSWFERTFGHRTITHDTAWIVPLFIVSIFLKKWWLIALMLGIFGHVLLDGFTTKGVPFLYFRNDLSDIPEYCKKNKNIYFIFKALRVRSDGFSAKLLTFAISIISLCVAFYIAYYRGLLN